MCNYGRMVLDLVVVFLESYTSNTRKTIPNASGVENIFNLTNLKCMDG